MTKTERLLREIRLRKGMTHKQIVQFLLDLRDGFGRTEFDYIYHRDFWNASLYGTRDRTGVLENFCAQDWTGRYRVIHNIEAPFTTKREDFDERFY